MEELTPVQEYFNLWVEKNEADTRGEEDLSEVIADDMDKVWHTLSSKDVLEFKDMCYWYSRKERYAGAPKWYAMGGELVFLNISAEEMVERAFVKAKYSGQPVMIYEGRKAQAEDIDFNKLVKDLKGWLDERVNDLNEFSTEDGGPQLIDNGRLDLALRHLVQALRDDCIDMGDSCVIDIIEYAMVEPSGFTLLKGRWQN